eukprot:1161075-Pelagomonas_calceolata.AAC.5
MVKSGGQFVDVQASCGCLEGQEQVNTLFVWVGALEGGYWGRGPGGSSAKFTRAFHEKTFSSLLVVL